MTLYGAYVGGTAQEIYDLEGWLGGGERWDGYLAYTSGNSPDSEWSGLRPINKTEPPNTGALGGSGRNLLWSIMMIPDGDVGQSVNWYREVASGARNGLYNQMGIDLMSYADRIGWTGPIYVRSTWEIPGEWFLWNQAGDNAQGGDTQAYKGAWRNFATNLRAGRPRIKTVWDFNSDRGPPGYSLVEDLYPGDDLIDVIGQDIYWIHDLQGVDPVAAFDRSRNGYFRGLQWNFDFCKARRKPMAISEFGVKTRNRPFQLDSTTWFQQFFAYVDEVNSDPDVGMAYVTWWSNAEANVGNDGTRGFLDEAGEPHLTNVRNMWRARLPGTILGTTGDAVGGGLLHFPLADNPPAGTAQNRYAMSAIRQAVDRIGGSLRDYGPSTTFASTGYALVKSGGGAIVYSPNGGAFNVNLAGWSGNWQTRWVRTNDPSISWVDGVVLAGGTTRSASPPSGITGSAAVVLTAA